MKTTCLNFFVLIFAAAFAHQINAGRLTIHNQSQANLEIGVDDTPERVSIPPGTTFSREYIDGFTKISYVAKEENHDGDLEHAAIQNSFLRNFPVKRNQNYSLTQTGVGVYFCPPGSPDDLINALGVSSERMKALTTQIRELEGSNENQALIADLKSEHQMANSKINEKFKEIYSDLASSLGDELMTLSSQQILDMASITLQKHAPNLAIGPKQEMEFTFLRIEKHLEDDVFVFRREIDDFTFYLDSHNRSRPILDVRVAQ